jgi:hypothetical protein
MGYVLEGRLLEVCNCNVLCPCWVGEDPDNGTCDSINAWHIDRGVIDGVDVSGRTVAQLVHIPGNVLTPHSWRLVLCLDDGASLEQEQALVDTWTGRRGGPLADVAGLVGEIIAVERRPITFDVEGGKGTLTIGDLADCRLEPYMGATGRATALSETAFSTIPGSPAYVGKASKYERTVSVYGLADIRLEGHNAIQGFFKFES